MFFHIDSILVVLSIPAVRPGQRLFFPLPFREEVRDYGKIKFLTTADEKNCTDTHN
jgi:hypothetical protein